MKKDLKDIKDIKDKKDKIILCLFGPLCPFGLLCLLLSSCCMGPSYVSPEIDVPYEWCSPISEGMTENPPDCFLWWEALNDETLNCLMDEAYENNLDLSIAATRIIEARLERKGKCAESYPRLDASATAGHLYYNKDLLVNDILGNALTPDQENAVKRNVSFYEIGFDAVWEMDLFGIRAHEIKSIQAKIQAAEENLCDIWVTLSAEVARNYIELRALQRRQVLIQKNIAAQKEIVGLTNQLLETGFTSIIDVNQAKEQLHTLQAGEPALQFAIEKAIHRISILVGDFPCELNCLLIESKPLPQLPCEKPIGIPSELMRRRPDIRRAERNLASASELVGSAVASLFPRFSIAAFVGNICGDPGKLFSSASNTWFAAPQLLWPIFNSKLVKQNIEYNKIKTQEALYEYQKTVLGALEETENALSAFYHEEKRNEFLKQATESEREAYDMTLDLYEKGLKDYLAVLILSRTHLVAEDAYMQSRMALLMNYISLYKALGGAW